MAAFPSDPIFIHPFDETILFKTLTSEFDDLGEEKRKQKWLYPKRNIALKYKAITKTKALILWQFYLARKGAYTAFSFFFPWTNTFEGEYVNTGDGSTVVFNLPSKQASAYILYVDGLAQEAGGADYTFGPLGGTDGADKVTFGSAPTDGARITWDFTGYLKVRSRFEEDKMNFVTFYDRLVNSKLKLKGLLNA